MSKASKTEKDRVRGNLRGWLKDDEPEVEVKVCCTDPFVRSASQKSLTLTRGMSVESLQQQQSPREECNSDTDSSIKDHAKDADVGIEMDAEGNTLAFDSKAVLSSGCLRSLLSMCYQIPKNPIPNVKANVVHSKIWSASAKKFEEISDRDVKKLMEGVPTMEMALAVQKCQSWTTLIKTGAVSPKYALTSMVEQLNNYTLVSVLLAGFAISFAVTPPEFSNNEALSKEAQATLALIYGTAMLFAGVSNFGATAVSLHSVNMFSNIIPTKASAFYVTTNIFFPARHAVRRYVFRGILGTVIGLTCAFVQNFSHFYCIPALVISTCFLGWFIMLYRLWYKDVWAHSCVADALAGMDMVQAAENDDCINEGIFRTT